MSAPTVSDLLPIVRRWVLEHRAACDRERDGFGLSYAVEQLTPTKLQKFRRINSLWLSTQPSIWRGRIQQCLTFLAHEGIMFTRQHTEGGVESYGHCETDKRFRLRITQAEAIRRLRKMK